jgi:hypothetical protein
LNLSHQFKFQGRRKQYWIGGTCHARGIEHAPPEKLISKHGVKSCILG